VQRLAALAAQKGYSLFLLGAAPGVAVETAARLCGTYPGVRIAGTHAGSPVLEEEDEIVRLIQKAKPDVLLVAYGAPPAGQVDRPQSGAAGSAGGHGRGGSLRFHLWSRPEGPSLGAATGPGVAAPALPRAVAVAQNVGLAEICVAGDMGAFDKRLKVCYSKIWKFLLLEIEWRR
jgi:hypothetical protein